jgi:hypothetical protein
VNLEGDSIHLIFMWMAGCSHTVNHVGKEVHKHLGWGVGDLAAAISPGIICWRTMAQGLTNSAWIGDIIRALTIPVLIVACFSRSSFIGQFLDFTLSRLGLRWPNENFVDFYLGTDLCRASFGDYP